MNPSTSLITPLILTYNEAPNIARTLDKLKWASQVLVVDSFSSDETVNICRRFSNVQIVQRAFDSFGQQCNFGLELIKTEWVLSLDADYQLSNALIEEIKSLDLTICDGYRARFIYNVYGHSLRSTLYPPRTVLYRRDRAIYENDGHGHRVQVTGTVNDLRSCIYHDDRKSLSRWLQSQDKYMILEVQKLMHTSTDQLSRTDRIRRGKILAPVLTLLYCLFYKQLLFDGWPGWYYTMQRVLAETVLSLRLIEAEHFDLNFDSHSS